MKIIYKVDQYFIVNTFRAILYTGGYINVKNPITTLVWHIPFLLQWTKASPFSKNIFFM